MLPPPPSPLLPSFFSSSFSSSFPSSSSVLLLLSPPPPPPPPSPQSSSSSSFSSFSSSVLLLLSLRMYDTFSVVVLLFLLFKRLDLSLNRSYSAAIRRHCLVTFGILTFDSNLISISTTYYYSTYRKCSLALHLSVEFLPSLQ